MIAVFFLCKLFFLRLLKLLKMNSSEFLDILELARLYLSCFNGQSFTRSLDVNPHSLLIYACLTLLDENLHVGATENKI